MRKKDIEKLTELVENLSIEIKNAKIDLRETKATLEFVIEHGKDAVVTGFSRDHYGLIEYSYSVKYIYLNKVKTCDTGIPNLPELKTENKLEVLRNDSRTIILKRNGFYYQINKKSGNCVNIPEPLFVNQENKELKDQL